MHRNNRKARPLSFAERGSGYLALSEHFAERAFARYLVSETGCWLWTGPIKPSGYPNVFEYRGARQPAHRHFYERFVGPIPVGLDLDHLCRTRRCVNPAHLEPVTRLENMRRARTAALGRLLAPLSRGIARSCQRPE